MKKNIFLQKKNRRGTLRKKYLHNIIIYKSTNGCKLLCKKLSSILVRFFSSSYDI